LFFAAEIDRLAQKAALDRDIRVNLAQFVSLAAWVAGNTKGIAQPNL